jgi:hypothetical protein
VRIGAAASLLPSARRPLPRGTRRRSDGSSYDASS